MTQNKKNLPEFLTKPNPQIYRTCDDYIVADCETTNTEFGSALVDTNSLVLAVWAFPTDATRGSLDYRYKFGNEFKLQKFRQAVEGARFLVAHNGKFELQWLKRCGLDLTNILVFDTLLAEKVILGNRAGPLDLDSVASKYGVGRKHALGNALVHGGVSSADVPEEILLPYCKNDVEITHEVFKKQLEVLDDELLAVVFTRCLLTPVLADIEFNGLQLDKERVDNEYERLCALHRDCSLRLSDITGGINLNSGKQVGEFLYTTLGFEEITDRRGNPLRTATGRPRTDSEVYGLLRGTNKYQRDFLRLKLEYNKLEAALSKYIRKFKVEVDGNNSGLIRATFNQARTQTHRLSSSGFGECRVQFQNLDRAYKKLFRARNKDWLIAEADGAQLEFRVAGFLGQDAMVVADILSEADIHSYTARVLTEAGQETSRQDAKTHTFKPLYGGVSGTIAERTYYDAFRSKYRGVYQTQRGWVDTVLRSASGYGNVSKGVLHTPWGLKFYWPDTRVERKGYTKNTSSIFNYPIQSLATAEIIPIAVVYFWHLIKAHGAQMLLVNTVHDSIICEIPPEERELFKELVVNAMGMKVYEYLYNVYKMKFNIPLGAELKIGTYWGEGDSIKINIIECPWNFNERK